MRLLLGTLLPGTPAAGAAPAISEGVGAHSAPFRPDPGPVPPPLFRTDGVPTRTRTRYACQLLSTRNIRRFRPGQSQL